MDISTQPELTVKQRQFNAAMEVYTSRLRYRLFGMTVALANVVLQAWLLWLLRPLSIGAGGQLLALGCAWLLADFLNGLVHMYMDNNDRYDSLVLMRFTMRFFRNVICPSTRFFLKKEPPDHSGHRAPFAVIKQLVTVVIFSLSLVFSAHAANLTIDGAQRLQTIDGMGVNINVNNWNNGQLKPALDFLVTSNGSTLFRVVRDPMDWVESESLIPALHALNPSILQQVYETPKMQDIWNTIDYLNQKGIGGRQIILNFMGWTPSWIGGSGAYGGASYITAGKEQEFATMIASLVYYGKMVKGLDFTYLSPMNEEDWNCLEGPCAASAQYTTILHDLSAELNYMGITDVRFVAPDTASVGSGMGYIAQMMADSTVAERTDHFALHDYSGTPLSPGTVFSGKNYWLTETSAWCSSCDAGVSEPPDEWSFATQTTDVILGDLKNGFAAILTWEAYDGFWYHHNASSLWGLLAYNPVTGIYTPRKRAYAYAQFNHFIGPGDVVIGSSESISSVPTTVAVHNATTGKIAIVGRNSGNPVITINGQLYNLPLVNTLALYETSTSVNLSRKSDVPVVGGMFTTQISGDAIFTLTNQPIAFDLVPPTVSVTSPLNGTQVSGTIEAVVNASDNNMLAGVQFVLDGASIGQESATSPKSMSMNTTALSNGVHTLSAVARDTAGNETISQPVSFTVNNGGSLLPVAEVVGGNRYTSIAEALDAAPASGTIHIKAMTFLEEVNMSHPKSLIFRGGYGPNFESPTQGAMTTINGLNISNSTLTVENMVIQ